MAKGKKINLGIKDVAAGVGGAILAFALNIPINKFLETQPDMKENVKKVSPLAKIGLGGYVAVNKKMDRLLRMGGAGFAAAGGIEAAATHLPELVSIKGTGDIFDMIGSPDVLEIPIAPSARLENSRDRAILGTDVYAEAYAEDRPML